MSEVFDPENVRIIVLDGDSDSLWTEDSELDPLPMKLVPASDYNQLLALYRAAVPLHDPCVGDPCWFNQETGYRELCAKHEEIARSSQSVVK